MKKKSFNLLVAGVRLIIVQTIFLFSCSQKTENKNSEKKFIQQVSPTISLKDTTTSSGEIYPKIFCRKDSSQSYAIYLPSNYSAEIKFPVIYFFDSHAEGILPMEKYKSLAEKYGYIIAGSNNSKNGLPWESTQQIIRNFFDDVQQKFSIDSKRIYTSGFSGGARVASSVALINGGVAGVAACGAGFGSTNEQPNGKFVFAGIVGNADFNLTEMKNLERSLETSSLEHHLLIFDGKHEWCPVEIMEEAFQIFEISTMKNKNTEQNESLIQNYIQKKEKEVSQYKNKKQIVAQWNLLRELSTALYGLSDVSKYKEEIISLENSPTLIAELKKEIDSEKAELAKQQLYSTAFTTKNFGWWNCEIISLHNEKSLQSKRLLSYLGLVAYMFSTGALNKNQSEQTNLFLKIYETLEPKNSEHQYLRAQFFMKTNQPEKALASLKSAVALGFKDKERLENDENFYTLKDTKLYQEIIIQISK